MSTNHNERQFADVNCNAKGTSNCPPVITSVTGGRTEKNGLSLSRENSAEDKDMIDNIQSRKNPGMYKHVAILIE